MEKGGLFKFLLLLALTVVLPFQNCGKLEVDEHNQGTQILSAQCLAKLKGDSNELTQFSSDDCQVSQNYECDRRIFSPYELNRSFLEKICFAEGDHNREICLPTKTFKYDTSAAIGPSLYEEGKAGPNEYNYEEYSCYFSGLKRGEAALITADGDSIEEAYAKTKAACLKRSRQ